MITFTLYVTIGLLILTVFMLAMAYRRILYMRSSHKHFEEWAWSNEKALRDCGRLLDDQLVVLYQVGELLDHAGVDLEQSIFKDEAEDLKKVGALLREMKVQINPWSLEPHQALLFELGDKYGIEPPGRLYDLRQVIRISEEIFERVLAAHKPERPVALSA